MSRLRRAVDHAMIFASLLALVWPLVLADGGRVEPWDAVALPVVVVLSVGVARLAGRYRTAGYAPAAAALLMAAAGHGAHPRLIVGLAAIMLLRQVLSTPADDGEPLTRLGNRTRFMAHARDTLADAGDAMTAVVVFDLDGFQDVNDTHGHAAGDALLRVAAERLDANVRGDDAVSRLDGDEFAVLLPRLTDDLIADTVAHRILHDLRQPIAIDDVVLTIRASAGIAIMRGPRIDADSLVREAEEALRQAKEDGKGVARRFDPARFAEAEQRRHEETELRRALAENQFEVHYQPIVHLDGEHAVGVEALVRWRHPARGLLPPGAFLDLAESLGMMPELGLWVLREACRQAVGWQRKIDGFELNVNLSASQLGNPMLVDEVRDVLTETGIDPSLLVLELTESVALVDLGESARVLGALKTLGVRIALDDFGTGFSSLSHLGVLPVDVVKIDKSFVQAMQDSPAGGSVAEAVLQIARTFHLSPVAEGVEDENQASRLRDLDCGQAQGYHFARPMPADNVTDLLIRQSVS
nr:bifunctional diguanylate cyclase/phosphodiesterase [uncultured Actinoplanes sp.]